jgi:hypothetical protein
MVPAEREKANAAWRRERRSRWVGDWGEGGMMNGVPEGERVGFIGEVAGEE